MAKSPKICQKLHFLIPKIMLNTGQNYQLYTSDLIIYKKVGSCKKLKKLDKENLRYKKIAQNLPKICFFDP